MWSSKHHCSKAWWFNYKGGTRYKGGNTTLAASTPKQLAKRYLLLEKDHFALQGWLGAQCLGLSYRNQSSELQSKSVDWCLYDRDLHFFKRIGFVKLNATIVKVTNPYCAPKDVELKFMHQIGFFFVSLFVIGLK